LAASGAELDLSLRSRRAYSQARSLELGAR
jgi:hypothetical protein